MRNRKAFITHHRNQTHAAIERSRAQRFTIRGMKPGSKSSGAAVTYCSACSAPVVDSTAGRARHAQKGGKCAEAMARTVKPSADLQ